MTKWFWLVGVILVGVTSALLWESFTEPTFVAAVSAAMSSLVTGFVMGKIFKRKTLDEEAIDRDYFRRGEIAPTKNRKHPNEH